MIRGFESHALRVRDHAAELQVRNLGTHRNRSRGRSDASGVYSRSVHRFRWCSGWLPHTVSARFRRSWGCWVRMPGGVVWGALAGERPACGLARRMRGDEDDVIRPPKAGELRRCAGLGEDVPARRHAEQLADDVVVLSDGLAAGWPHLARSRRPVCHPYEAVACQGKWRTGRPRHQRPHPRELRHPTGQANHQDERGPGGPSITQFGPQACDVQLSTIRASRAVASPGIGSESSVVARRRAGLSARWGTRGAQGTAATPCLQECGRCPPLVRLAGQAWDGPAQPASAANS